MREEDLQGCVNALLFLFNGARDEGLDARSFHQGLIRHTNASADVAKVRLCPPPCPL